MTELIYLPPLMWSKQADAHICRLGRLWVGTVRKIERLRNGHQYVLHVAGEQADFAITLEEAKRAFEAKVLMLLQAPE